MVWRSASSFPPPARVSKGRDIGAVCDDGGGDDSDDSDAYDDGGDYVEDFCR